MALDALLRELRTPEGTARAVGYEVARERASAARLLAEPMFDEPHNSEAVEESERRATELERSVILPGLGSLG